MKRTRKNLLLALKIGLGSSIAIIIAQSLHLEYAVSAGTVTLLTLMTSKWETIRLSVSRLATFALTAVLAWVIFHLVDSIWVTYGLLLTLVVFIAETCGWRSTISVNSVAVAHLVTAGKGLTVGAIWNELQLVLIGVVIAVVLNLFHANLTHKREIVAAMRETESRLQSILRGLADYLSGSEMAEHVWSDICTLEADILNYIQSANEYQENTFVSHPQYYISYFEMRYEQCRILHNLHYELVKIQSIPRQARTVADYLYYLVDYVIEINTPDQQIQRLNGIFAAMKEEELPQSRDEFEDRALLFHVLMDIQDFLICKADFVAKMDDQQRTLYWGNSDSAFFLKDKVMK